MPLQSLQLVLICHLTMMVEVLIVIFHGIIWGTFFCSSDTGSKHKRLLIHVSTKDVFQNILRKISLPKSEEMPCKIFFETMQGM